MGANAFGQSLLRKEDRRLLTGAGRYTGDIRLPGQVYAAMLRSPHAHAMIRGIDVTAARTMPGVLAIYTGEDVLAAGLVGLASGAELIRLANTRSDGAYLARPPHPLIATGRVRFVGDTVAMAIAETEAQARDAVEAIVVDYDPLPTVTDTAAAQAGPPVWDEAPDNVCFRWTAGDAAAVEAAFASAAQTARVELVNNRVYVGSLENRAAIGAFAADTGRYTLRTGSQMPHQLKQALARALGEEPNRIRVLIADVGGSFGIKNSPYREQVLVLWAARLLGRPVAWYGERTDGVLSDYQGRDNVSVAELALDGDGRFLALRVRTAANLGAYIGPKGNLSPTTNTPALAGVYRLPAIHVEVTGVFTNTAPTEVYRGAGRPEAVYVLERLVDEAARQLGYDRIELRRRNTLSPQELPFRTALGLIYDSGDFPRMLDEALARADWEGFPARRAAARSAGKLRGIGLAHYCERVAGAWAENAWVELAPSGRVTVLIGTMSNGQGHETAYAQLVADALGIRPDQVDVIQGDTDRIPLGYGTGGSASLGIGGAALVEASGDLIRKALPLAADALEAATADVAFADGAFRIVGTDRAIGLGDVAARLGVNGGPEILEGSGYWKPAAPTFPNGCHVAEVEIDPETGETTVIRYTMVHDFGRVLNPLLLEGQLQGGVAQGLGQALYEQVAFDPASGQVLTGSLMDYHMARADELPPLELVTLATVSPSNPLGVKGCGEAGAAGAPPAVINAIHDALPPARTRKLDMPATSERVWYALGAVLS